MTTRAGPRRLPLVRVLPTADAVAEAAATGIVAALAAAIAERGIAHWATTGGSAAPGIYRRLRVPPLRDLVDWSRVHVWWGDDRFVPADDPLSNVLPLDEILLAAEGTTATTGVRIPDRTCTRSRSPRRSSTARARPVRRRLYETSLLLDGPGRDAEGVPVLDLLVLGVGPDGHVLSVFPGSAVWDEAVVCAVPAPTHIEPHVERVTMHPDVVAAARIRARGVHRGVQGCRARPGLGRRRRPRAAGPLTMATNATWILDEAAAAELPRGLTRRGRAVPRRGRAGSSPSRDGTSIAGVLRGRGRIGAAGARDERGPLDVAGGWPGRSRAGAGPCAGSARPRGLRRLGRPMRSTGSWRMSPTSRTRSRPRPGAGSTSSGIRWAAGSRWPPVGATGSIRRVVAYESGARDT